MNVVANGSPRAVDDGATIDSFVAGARLAIEDNNTTGKFLNQHFTLEEVRLKDGDRLEVVRAVAGG